MVIQHISQALGTLAQNVALSVGTRIDAARLMGTRIKRFEYAVSFRGKTAAEGPIIWGFARGGVSQTEIVDFINADPQSSLDTPAIDEAQLDVYPIGIFGLEQTNAPGADSDHVMEYKQFSWPWKKMPEGDQLNVFFMNIGVTLQSGTIAEVHLKIIEEFERGL